jgi:hypothetical protein
MLDPIAWVKAQYWSRRDHRSVSAGASDAGLPVVLAADGKLGSSIIGAVLTGLGTIVTAGYNLTLGGHSTINGTLSGGGTVATGGFTATVPATGTVALLGTANVFTTQQRVDPAGTGVPGVHINMPVSTAFQALRIDYNTNQRQHAYVDSAGTNRYWILDVDAGVGAGPSIILGRNSNGSTPSAGFVQLANRSGTNYYLWVDDTGDLRVHTSAPVHGSDTAGTVVGTQS